MLRHSPNKRMRIGIGFFVAVLAVVTFGIWWMYIWTSGCEPGWYQYNSNCYKKMTGTNGWLGARIECSMEAGDLVSITSLDEENFVKGLMGEHTRFWIGLSNLKCSESWCDFEESQDMTWSDTGLTADYTNWDRNQHASLTDESCTYINQGAFENPDKWRRGLCGSSLAFMCKQQLKYNREPQCEREWRKYNSTCYKKMTGTNGWLGAHHECTWKGGNLVSITSLEEETFVKGVMSEHTQFWIGLSNMLCSDARCDFVRSWDMTWSDTGLTATYTNWSRSQHISLSDESCAYINQGAFKEPGKWRRGLCGSSLAFMCQRQLNGDLVVRLPSNKDANYIFKREETSYCDSGELLYGDFCYHFEKSLQSWQKAENLCVGREGHLASFHSDRERDFLTDHLIKEIHPIHQLFAHKPFLGLKKKKNKYEWSDHTPVLALSTEDDIKVSQGSDNNQSWLSSRKQDIVEWQGTSKNEICIVISDAGQLFEWPCSTPMRSVCKKGKTSMANQELKNCAEQSCFSNDTTCSCALSMIAHLNNQFVVPIPNGLSVSRIIVIRGRVNAEAKKVIVKIMARDQYVNTSTALLLTSDFSSRKVKLSAKGGSLAGTEKEFSKQSFPFGPGLNFKIVIQCDAEVFRVTINNIHQMEDKYNFEMSGSDVMLGLQTVNQMSASDVMLSSIKLM